MKNPIHSICSLLKQITGHSSLTAFANVSAGTHPGRITRTLGVALPVRYTLVKNGPQPGTVVPVVDASDRPLGIATDSGEVGDIVNINLIGIGSQTQLMVASVAIAEGTAVFQSAGGRVQKESNSSGVFYEIGTALSSASAAGELIEVAAIAPIRTVNIPAFDGNNTNDLNKLADALMLRPDKIRLLAV